MFQIFLHNTIIHNAEYTYDKSVTNLEEARMYCFFNKYDIVLFFKKEKKYWFSKSCPNMRFCFCSNSDLCDVYLVYKYENLLNFNLDINLRSDIEKNILFIIHGSLENYENESFKNKYRNQDCCFIVKNDKHIYKLDNIKSNYYFITDKEINLNLIYNYYNVISNIKNKKYKYIMCCRSDIIIPMNYDEFVNTNIEKIKSNIDNDIIISNDWDNFLFCKYSVFENFIFSKNYINIKPVQVILNDK